MKRFPGDPDEGDIPPEPGDEDEEDEELDERC